MFDVLVNDEINIADETNSYYQGLLRSYILGIFPVIGVYNLYNLS